MTTTAGVWSWYSLSDCPCLVLYLDWLCTTAQRRSAYASNNLFSLQPLAGVSNRQRLLSVVLGMEGAATVNYSILVRKPFVFEMT